MLGNKTRLSSKGTSKGQGTVIPTRERDAANCAVIPCVLGFPLYCSNLFQLYLMFKVIVPSQVLDFSAMFYCSGFSPLKSRLPKKFRPCSRVYASAIHRISSCESILSWGLFSLSHFLEHSVHLQTFPYNGVHKPFFCSNFLSLSQNKKEQFEHYRTQIARKPACDCRFKNDE